MDPIVSLQGRTIVVTGAGQGIGKGIVELAIELGANVVAVDLNGQTLDAAVSPLPQARVGSLTPDEYWAVVNFMLVAHGVPVPPEGVNASNAKNVPLKRAE